MTDPDDPFDLNVLRISLTDVSDTRVKVQLRSGAYGVDETLGVLKLRPEEFGLERVPRKTLAGDPEFAVPNKVLDLVESHIDDPLDRGRPLWIELRRPYGALCAVPWERAFTGLGFPVLRLPAVRMGYVHTDGSVDVVVIADDPLSEPEALAETLQAVADRIVRYTPLPAFVHVFTTAAVYRALPRSGWSTGRRSSIFVYDPEDAPKSPPAGQGIDIGTNEWLNWVICALGGRSADFVHLIAHGRLVSTGGAIVLSRTPTESGDVDLIGARDLSVATGALGAWGLVVQAPKHNTSGLATRLLADNLAQDRPVAVLHHDLALDPDLTGLAAGYAFIASPRPATPAISADLVSYCQPWQVRAEPGQQVPTEMIPTPPDFVDTEPITSGETEYIPAATAGTQRYAEELLWRLQKWRQAGLTDQVAQIVKLGVDQGLDLVKEELERHAYTSKPRSPVITASIIEAADESPERPGPHAIPRSPRGE